MWSKSIELLNPNDALKRKPEHFVVISFNSEEEKNAWVAKIQAQIKAKEKDVPKMYRRDRWQEFLSILMCTLVCAVSVAILMFVFAIPRMFPVV